MDINHPYPITSLETYFYFKHLVPPVNILSSNINQPINKFLHKSTLSLGTLIWRGIGARVVPGLRCLVICKTCISLVITLLKV